MRADLASDLDILGDDMPIKILNIQSYPVVGGSWITNFQTLGEADLKITPFNGTLFEKDLEFTSLKCEDRIVEPTELTDLYVKFDNYYCFSESHFEIKVISSGVHTLRFEFGSEVGYSYNEAELKNVPKLIAKEAFDHYEPNPENPEENISIYVTKQVWVYEDSEKYIEVDNNVRCRWYVERPLRECYLPVFVEYKNTDEKELSEVKPIAFFEKDKKSNLKYKYNDQKITASVLKEKGEIKDDTLLSKGNHSFMIEFDYPPNSGREKINVTVFGVLFDPEIDDCAELSSPGVYLLNTSIINSTDAYCMQFKTTNMTLDCQGNTIDGNDTYVSAGVRYYNYPYDQWANLTVKNCILTDWYFGTSINGNNNTFLNNTASSCNSGLRIDNSKYTIFTGNTANSNVYGIYVYQTDYSIFSNNTVENNSNLGFRVSFSSNNIIHSNFIRNNTIGFGIGGDADTNLIYNNFLNNSDNIFFYAYDANYFNTTNQTGTNIIGGPFTGGSFWGTPTGTGFSEDCSDANYNEYCDKSYTLGADNIDYLPLCANGSIGILPTYSNELTSTTSAGIKCKFTSEWTDTNLNGGSYIFSTNNTGVWVNDTVGTFTASTQNATAYHTLNSTVGTIIAWCFYGTDKSVNTNDTNCQEGNYFTLTTTSTAISQNNYLNYLSYSHKAYEGNDSSLPSDPWDYSNEANTTNYDNINSSNNVRWATSLAGDKEYDYQIFHLNISENKTTAEKLEILWEGHGANATEDFPVGLYIWNVIDTEWTELNSTNINATIDTTWRYSFDIESGIEDYINTSSEDNWVYVLSTFFNYVATESEEVCGCSGTFDCTDICADDEECCSFMDDDFGVCTWTGSLCVDEVACYDACADDPECCEYIVDEYGVDCHYNEFCAGIITDCAELDEMVCEGDEGDCTYFGCGYTGGACSGTMEWTCYDMGVELADFDWACEFSECEACGETLYTDYIELNVTYSIAPDTCTCPGLDTDWEIDMSDYCNITENCELGIGYLNFTGTGETRCNATINTTSMGDPGANGILYIQDSCLIYIRS